MDNRTLVALGMILAVVWSAMMRGALNGAEVKELLVFLSGGVIGFTVPRAGQRDALKPPKVPPLAGALIIAGSLLLLVGCVR